MYEKDAERFWSKVAISGRDECWEWRAGKIPQGYGSFWLNGGTRRAHCVAWEIANDVAIPDGNIICHHCDNVACVNPAHLYLGTFQTNAIDRERRGRANRACGEAHHTCKLSEEMVREIRVLYGSGGWTLERVARKYNISFQHVSDIYHRKSWAHVE